MDNKLSPIPGYEDLYWVDLQTGFVYNKSEHQIKPIYTDKGMLVELRKYGQRERIPVADIIAKLWEEQNESLFDVPGYN